MVSVASVLSLVPLNVSFRRGLVGNNLVLWHRLVTTLVHVNLNEAKDIFKWKLHQNKMFTVHSMYNALMSNGVVMRERSLWNLKVPLKIKIFMWYLKKGVVLTKDNLGHRNCHGNKKCEFCSCNETIQHLFFECHYARFIWRVVQFTFGLEVPVSMDHMFGVWLIGFSKKNKSLIMAGVVALCWAIWLSRNDLVFEKCSLKTYMQVLYRGTHWCRFWAQLQKHEEDRTVVKEACRALETTVMQVFASFGWRFSYRLL